MPLDAVTLAALTQELRPELEGAKIDKIQQPERDMLLLSLRCRSGNKRLLITAGTGNARVHFTAESMENPAEPPMFCMLLRKHLTGARIRSVEQPNRERMLRLTLETHDELGDSADKSLIVEMIGRSSNVILVGADGRIIDCLRRMDYAGDSERRLLPGMFYRLPPRQEKTDFFTTTPEQRREMIAQAYADMPVDKWLLYTFSGLSPLICREMAQRSGERFDTLPEQLDALAELIAEAEYVPVLLTENGQARDFSFMPIRQYGDTVNNERLNSFCELLDAYYARRDRAERQRRRSHDLMRSVKTIRDRLQKKLALQREELLRTEKREEVRKTAELITANLYRMKKGDRVLVCEDYYEEGAPEIRIPLDELKTPQQNAAALYKEYNKLKSAREHLLSLISEGDRQLDYLNSVLDQLERAETEKDVAELRRELTESGYLRQRKAGKPERIKPAAPWHFVTDDGLEVLVGRSNLQNDELTTKLARRTDYWLHTQKVHGSHVILRCEGLEPPERSLEQAAALAAWFSQGREGGKTAVDYTMIRFVRKPSGSLPGFVTYTDYKTMLAEADESLVERLKIK